MKIAIFGCGNIGFETAVCLLKEAYVSKIYIFNRSFPEYLKDLLASDNHAAKVIDFCLTDAQDENAVEKAILSHINSKIDILICTIGTNPVAEAHKDFKQFIFDFELNFFGSLIPVVKTIKNKSFNSNSRIIIISSTSGHHAPKDLTSYSPSKWALENLYSSLRGELKEKDIKIDIVCPTTLKNRYSKVFNFNHGIDPYLVADKIKRIIKTEQQGFSVESNPLKRTGKTSPGNDYFIPFYYRLVRLLEKIYPRILDFRAGLNLKFIRNRKYKNFAINNVLITGAAGGLGKELSYIYSKKSRRLFLIDKNEEGLKEVKKNIEADSNCHVSINTVDISKLEEVSEVVDALPEIDLLINCAGMHIRSSICDTPIDIYKKFLTINFFSSVLFISKLLNKKIPKKIINIISSTAIAGRKNLGVYSSSKAALWAFTRSLRRKYGNDMLVAEVLPGTFVSDLFKSGIRLDGTRCDNPDPLKFLSACDVAKIIFKKEQKCGEIIVTSVKVRIYLLLQTLFPCFLRRFFN